MRALFIPILLCATLQAETPSEALKRRRLEYPDLSQIVDLAQSAPSEFAARALLRVAQSPSLHDKTWKGELLEQAFQTAASARTPVGRHIGNGLAANGSREQRIAEASDMGLDHLMLQSLAVNAMLALNPKRARELFLEIPKPVPARLRCEDALVEDPSIYFATATTIAGIGFTPEERKRDEAALFLNERVQRLTSAVELAPAIRMVSAASRIMTSAQYKLLTSSLAAAFERISGDNRAFASALPEISKEMTVFRGSELNEAYRQFLVKNLTGPRCADSDLGDFARSAVADFNSGINATVIPIKLDDIKPSRMDAKAMVTYSGNRAEEALLSAKLTSLLLGDGHAALTDQQKNTAEWREQFSDALHNIEGIKPAIGESEALFYYRKGTALRGLLLVAPSGESRDKILQEYISFLKASNFQQESLIEWFGMVESLAADTRSMNAGEFQKMLNAFEASGHAVLSLYARMERMLPTAPVWAQTAP